MADLLTISLHNVRFRAFHGLYPEERQKGNDFVVNMDVSYPAPGHVITGLAETIDYARLFSIMNTVMENPVDLLETVAQVIGRQVKQAYPQVVRVKVEVQKLQPPIDQFSGVAQVCYEASFNE